MIYWKYVFGRSDDPDTPDLSGPHPVPGNAPEPERGQGCVNGGDFGPHPRAGLAARRTRLEVRGWMLQPKADPGERPEVDSAEGRDFSSPGSAAKPP